MGRNKQICKKGAQDLSVLIYKMGTMITLRRVVRMESDRASRELSTHFEFPPLFLQLQSQCSKQKALKVKSLSV